MASPASVAGFCTRYLDGPTQSVDFVFDGDSLALKDASQVRLVGVNTPELGHGGVSEQPFATQARDHLRDLVMAADRQIRLRPAEETRDHYGRQLAYGYTQDGASLAESLVAAGLGVVLVIPPNESLSACLQQAETQARRARRGVWGKWPLRATDLGPKTEGFQIIRGRVEHVGRSRHSQWLDLEANLAVRIDQEDLQGFEKVDLTGLEGQEVEVRGWVKPAYRGLRMRVRHPSGVQAVTPTPARSSRP